ncbi:hypothetical protein ACFCZV_21865 [Streptomyces hydrogenans]|uniref:hypothetical protein n=1 Tax=Streptomyces hydrogenans TaxID=1873719 RepID=UPI0035DF2AE6
MGIEGSIGDRGASTHFACEPALSLTRSGKFGSLEIGLINVPDEEKARNALPGRLREFPAFAERELQCAGGSAGR